MAGFNPNQPRDKEGQWSRIGAALSSGIRGLGRGLASGGRTIGSIATFRTGDPSTDASLKIAAIKGGAGLAHAGLQIGARHVANKAIAKAYSDAHRQSMKQAKRGRPSKSSSAPRGPYDFIDVSSHAGYGTTPPKVPTHYSKNDEKGFKVNFYVSKVEKKRRPTFPAGYKKSILDDL